MKIIANYVLTAYPPLLSLYIHDAPHRRMHVKTIQQYREFIRQACTAAGIVTPIGVPVDLDVLFVNPSSPDCDNLLTALFQALDGSTLRGPGILTDDGLVQRVRMSKMWPAKKK
jgi:Holliday junction resolvase RusA-like endonuclease